MPKCLWYSGLVCPVLCANFTVVWSVVWSLLYSKKKIIHSLFHCAIKKFIIESCTCIKHKKQWVKAYYIGVIGYCKNPLVKEKWISLWFKKLVELSTPFHKVIVFFLKSTSILKNLNSFAGKKIYNFYCLLLLR